MKHTLFGIGADALALEELLEAHLMQSGGEISPDVEAAFDDWLRENQENLLSKLDGYGALIQEWEAKAEARKNEAKRLAELAKVDENKARWAKERLKIFFELTGRTKEETERFKFSLARNGGKLPLVIDEGTEVEDVPVAFTKRELDHEMIRAALEHGDTLQFARLGTRGTHLKIR